MLSYYRYIGVVRSLQTSSLSTIEMARIHVALVLIISFILEIPRYFELQISELTCNGNRFLIPITTDLVYNQVYHILYRSIFTVIVRRILPLVITSILTFCMVKYLREQNQRRKRLLASHTSTNGEIMPASNEWQRVFFSTHFCELAYFFGCHLFLNFFPMDFFPSDDFRRIYIQFFCDYH